jgi:mono/diheme cytochrome c family protein
MMRKTMLVVATVSGALLMLPAQAQTTSSVWDGIYTLAQAARGADDFAQVCAACHGAALGGSGEAPALSGGQFGGDFDGQTVGDIFDRIRTSMPQSAPGVLEREQYADILAFLLKSNGFPAGQTELDTQSEILKTISFEASKPDRPGKP